MNTILKLVLAIGLGFTLPACDWEDDDDFNHQPAEGLGTLIVDNNSGTDVRVFVNGERQSDVDSVDETFTDLVPGVYRVVLDDRHGDANESVEVDVVEGRLTIIEIATDPSNIRGFDLAVFFENGG
jgi:hypothetical protein